MALDITTLSTFTNRFSILKPVMESLCHVCRTINFDRLLFGIPTWSARGDRPRGYNSAGWRDNAILLGSVEDVQQRAANSCGMCDLALGRLTQRNAQDGEFEHAQLDKVSSVWEVWLCSISTIEEANKILAHFVPPYDYRSKFWVSDQRELRCIYLLDDTKSPAQAVDDELDIKKLRNWVTKCQKNHICEIRASDLRTKFLSQLFLRASSKAFGSHHQIEPPLKNFKLIDVHSHRIFEENFRRFPEYAALSYTWGSEGDNCFLTKDQLLWRIDANGVRSIPLPDLLPNTIVDAMTITKKMGLAYLWIDCLCIVQDDEQEKHKQIEHMDSIYTNATFCIVALAGTGVDAGLPGVRPGTRKKQLVAKVQENRTLCLFSPTLEGLIIESRWGSRAWTFQEFMLSRRHLIFSETEAIFQCSDIRCRESSKYEDKRLFYFDRGQGVQRAENMVDLFRFVYNHRGRRMGYCRCVEEYTTRSMTFDSDGLNAFAGISRLMEKFLQSEMIYGMPKRFMLESLGWCSRGSILRRRTQITVDEKGETVNRPIFPSWSWVAWDGAIQFEHTTWDGLGQGDDVYSELFLVELSPLIHRLVKSSQSDFASEGSSSTSPERSLSGILPLWTKCAYFSINTEKSQAVILKDASTVVGYFKINSNEERRAFPNNAWCMELYRIRSWCYVLVLGAFEYTIPENFVDREALTLHLAPASQDPLALAEHSGTKKFVNGVMSFVGMRDQLSSSKRRVQMTSDCTLLAYRIGFGRIEIDAWNGAKPQSRLVLLG